jgi:hypothetical protein
MVYGLLRALPGDQAFLTPSLDGQESAKLTPTSRRQDHTTSPSVLAPFVNGAIHVHRIPFRVRDDREPPLWKERDDGSIFQKSEFVKHNSEIQQLIGNPFDTLISTRRMGGAQRYPSRHALSAERWVSQALNPSGLFHAVR